MSEMTDARPIKLGDEDLPASASTPSSPAQGPKASPKPKAKPKAVPKSVSTTMAWGDLDVLERGVGKTLRCLLLNLYIFYCSIIFYVNAILYDEIFIIL